MSIFTFTPLNDPQAIDGAFAGTLAFGINASGQVVGYYNDNTGGGSHGFLYSGGTDTALDDPEGGSNGITIPQAISDSGRIVGFYQGQGTQPIGFIETGGNYTNLGDPQPGTSSTIVHGINAMVIQSQRCHPWLHRPR